ncbi:MAG: hypothetical protein ACJ8M1_06030 [Chthoniobacterales bacterium]
MKRDQLCDVTSNSTGIPSPGWLRRALFEDDHELGADLQSILLSPKYSQSVPRGAVLAAVLGALLITASLIAERELRHSSPQADTEGLSSDYMSSLGAVSGNINLPAAHFASEMQSYSGIDSLADQRDYTLAMLEASGATAGGQSFAANNGSAGGQSGAGLGGSHNSAGGFGGGGPESQQSGSTTDSTAATIPEGGSSLLFLAAALATMIAGQRVILHRFRRYREVR